MKNYRYPGVRPFNQEDKPLFFGRDKVIDTLVSRIKTEKTLFIYSRSGIGKTSLLNAGLLPVLSQDENNEIADIIRFYNFNEKDVSPYNKILQIIENSGKLKTGENFLNKLIPHHNSLWYHFKNHQISSGSHKCYYLFFDQFEELFTYTDFQIFEFTKQLSDLLYTGVPPDIRLKVTEESKKNPDSVTPENIRLLEAPMEIKVIFLIASDRINMLYKLLDGIPTIFNSRFELLPLSDEDAKEAIQLPAKLDNTHGNFKSHPFSYEDSALQTIIKSLASNNNKSIDSGQLQIICRYLEDKITPVKNKITLKDVEKIEDIFKDFYNNVLTRITDNDERDKARKLIEEELIKEERRVSLDEQVCAKLVTTNTLEILVNEHLLVKTLNNLNNASYELVSDSLINPIVRAFKIRKEQEDIYQKYLMNSVQIKKVRRNLIYAVTVIALFFLTLLFAGYEYFTANAERKKNEKFKDVVEKNGSNPVLVFDAKKHRYGYIDKNADVKIDYKYIRAETFDPYTSCAEVVLPNNINLLIDTDGNEFLFVKVISGIDTLRHDIASISLKDLKDTAWRAGANGRSGLWTKIFKMTNLRFLELKNCSLKILPEDIDSLVKLQKLELPFNQLSVFPAEISNLRELVILNFSNNKLSDIPRGISRLGKLKVMNLSHNKFRSIPPELNNIEVLYMENNDLSDLSLNRNNLAHLKELHLDSCGLTSLPAEIGGLSKLAKLDITGNIKIKSIPVELSNLKNLEAFEFTITSELMIPQEVLDLPKLNLNFDCIKYCYKRNNYKLGKQIASALLKKKGNLSPKDCWNLSYYCMIMGDPANAIEAGKAYCQITDSTGKVQSIGALSNLAMAYLWSGNVGEAKKIYEKYKYKTDPYYNNNGKTLFLNDIRDMQQTDVRPKDPAAVQDIIEFLNKK